MEGSKGGYYSRPYRNRPGLGAKIPVRRGWHVTHIVAIIPPSGLYGQSRCITPHVCSKMDMLETPDQIIFILILLEMISDRSGRQQILKNLRMK